MSYVVSARKYRPRRFDDVVGQAHVSQTLKKALQTGHLAHAFLFCGPRGVGKTTCARILAKVLNCLQPTADFEPCDECTHCLAFNEHASFNIMELDAASNNSVEHIRTLVEQVRFQPQQGKFKVFIIDEVHMLSQSAFNAFLKTLEEPPSYAVFILATTEKHKIIPTILSRCQIFDFKRISVADTVRHLETICHKENIQAEQEALHVMALKADGALRDALTLLDRIAAASDRKITYRQVIESLNVLDYEHYFRFTDALLQQDLPQVLSIFDEIYKNGFEGDLFINGLAEHLRNLLLCKEEAMVGLLEVSDLVKQRYHTQAHAAPASYLLTALNLCNECDVNYKMARQKRLHVELTLIKMCFINRALRLPAGSTSPANTAAPVAAEAEKKTAELSPKDDSPLDTGRQEPPAALFLAPTGKTNSGKDQPSTSSVNVPTSETLNAHEDSSAKPYATTTSGSRHPAEAAPTETAHDAPLPGESPETNTPEHPPATKSTVKPALRKPTGGSVPTLSTLASLQTEVEEAEVNSKTQHKEANLSLEALSSAWEAYMAVCEKESVKTMLKNTQITLEQEKVVATVGSALVESTIRQESNLMEFLRKQLHAPRLSLEIRLDPARSNAMPAPPKRLTDSEKYWRMKTLNPLVDEIRKRFDLHLDDE